MSNTQPAVPSLYCGGVVVAAALLVVTFGMAWGLGITALAWWADAEFNEWRNRSD